MEIFGPLWGLFWAERPVDGAGGFDVDRACFVLATPDGADNVVAAGGASPFWVNFAFARAVDVRAQNRVRVGLLALRREGLFGGFNLLKVAKAVVPSFDRHSRNEYPDEYNDGCETDYGCIPGEAGLI